MIPKLLIGVNLSCDPEFEKIVQGVEFQIESSVIDVIKSLKEQPNGFDYILIMSNSFAVTSGMDYTEVFDTLAEVLSKAQYEKILFADFQHTYESQFLRIKPQIIKSGYHSFDNAIEFRTIVNCIKSLLKDDKSKQQQKPEEDPVPPSIKKNFFSAKKKKEEDLEAKKKKMEEEAEAKRLAEEAKKAAKAQREEVKKKPDPVVKMEEVQLPKRDKITKEGIDKFRNTSVLFTSPIGKVGTTTASLMFAKTLVDNGLKVCYAQITRGVFTSNIFMKYSERMECEYSDTALTQALKDPRNNIGHLISIYQGVHFINNGVYETIEDYSKVGNLVRNLNSKFDCVVYDVDFDQLLENPLLLLLFKYKVLTMTNSYDSIITMANVMRIISDEENDSMLPVFESIINDFNILYTRVSKKLDNSGKEIKPQDTLALISEIDEDFSSIEMRPVVGYIPEKSEFSGLLFNKTNEEYIARVIKDME